MKKIFYNVTVIVEHDAHDEWLKWMTDTHIPEVMKTGKFIENKICRLLDVDETDGKTYSCQYIAPSMDVFQEYLKDCAPALKKDHTDKFKDKVVAFRSLMEIL